MNAYGENCAWSQYPTASWITPPPPPPPLCVTPWEIEVLLALLWAEHCVRLSVACFHCSLSSEAGSSAVWCCWPDSEQRAQGQEPGIGAEGCSLLPRGMRLF